MHLEGDHLGEAEFTANFTLGNVTLSLGKLVVHLFEEFAVL